MLSEKSLQQLSKAIVDGSLKITREKSVFRLVIPLDEKDVTEALVTMKVVRDETVKEIKKPGHDPDLEKAIMILDTVELQLAVGGGLQISVDAVKFFPQVQKIMDPFAAQHIPDEPTAQRRRAAVEAIKAKNIPIDAKTTVKQVVEEFQAGSLKGHPSERPVPPGEGLVEQK
jgi:hypothetical protein